MTHTNAYGLPLGSFVLMSLISTVAPAATLIPFSLDRLTREAEMIVVGRVGEQVSVHNSDRTLIVTQTTLTLEETIVGPSVSELTFVEHGGCVGDVCLAVPGLPRYTVGERVVVFLCRAGSGHLRTCGAMQGRLALQTRTGGETRAIGAMAGKPVDEPLDDLRASVLVARKELHR